MAATEYENQFVDIFWKGLGKGVAKKPKKRIGYTRTEILNDDRFKRAMQKAKQNDFSDDEIVQAVNAAIKNAGLEEKGLHFSKKEILALLEVKEEENKATKNKKQDTPNTASFDEGDTKDGEPK